MCVHREPAYEKQPWRKGSDLLHTERRRDHSALLPLFPGMTMEEQQQVAVALHEATMLHAHPVRTGR